MCVSVGGLICCPVTLAWGQSGYALLTFQQWDRSCRIVTIVWLCGKIKASPQHQDGLNLKKEKKRNKTKIFLHDSNASIRKHFSTSVNNSNMKLSIFYISRYADNIFWLFFKKKIDWESNWGFICLEQFSILSSIHNTLSATGSNQLLDKSEDYVLLCGLPVKSPLKPS